MEEEIGYLPENMKPKVLYHASQNREIDVLEPRADTVRDKAEGPVVFASPDKAGVTKFVVPTEDSWTRKMRFGDNHVMVICGRERFIEADKGGAIYQLNPDLFEQKNIEGGKSEWTSKVAVKPVEKEEYSSGLRAMVENGVKVYFVDENVFDAIDRASDHGYSIIKELKPEI